MDQPVTQQGQKMGFPDNLNQNNPANPPKDDDQSHDTLCCIVGRLRLFIQSYSRILKTLPGLCFQKNSTLLHQIRKTVVHWFN